MASTIKVTLNSEGVRDLLRSDGVRKDLRARADRIAAAAGPGHIADDETGRNRARAAVITATAEAMLSEATNHTLTRAIDAGR